MAIYELIFHPSGNTTKMTINKLKRQEHRIKRIEKNMTEEERRQQNFR